MAVCRVLALSCSMLGVGVIVPYRTPPLPLQSLTKALPFRARTSFQKNLVTRGAPWTQPEHTTGADRVRQVATSNMYREY
eukprot:3667714-Prymnesium_polylepis.1